MKKFSDIADAKKATGFNFRLDVPAISAEQIEQIRDVTLEPDFAKRLSKEEKHFLIIGAVLTDSVGKLSEIEDYLLSDAVKKPGDLFAYFGLKTGADLIASVGVITRTFNKVNADQQKWHEEAAAKQAEEGEKHKYTTNHVVHKFDDGWTVVYVPAAGECKAYPGLPGTSIDRIIEGNKNGLCLGSENRLYQENKQGKIYSVRNEKNEPKATIRVWANAVQEIKGKYNAVPDFETAQHVKPWLTQEGFERDTEDYYELPPVTPEELDIAIKEDANKFISMGWFIHYLHKSTIVDNLFEEYLTDPRKHGFLFYSGYQKINKKLMWPIVERFANEYSDNISKIFFTSSAAKRHESWIIYQDEPAVYSAVFTLAQNFYLDYLQLEIQKVPKYKRITRIIAENLITKSDTIDSDENEDDYSKTIPFEPYTFIKAELGKLFPDLEEEAVLAKALMRPIDWLHPKNQDFIEFHKKYPNVLKQVEAKLSANGARQADPISVLRYYDLNHLAEYFPELTKKILNTSYFISNRWHKDTYLWYFNFYYKHKNTIDKFVQNMDRWIVASYPSYPANFDIILKTDKKIAKEILEHISNTNPEILLKYTFDTVEFSDILEIPGLLDETAINAAKKSPSEFAKIYFANTRFFSEEVGLEFAKSSAENAPLTYIDNKLYEKYPQFAKHAFDSFLKLDTLDSDLQPQYYLKHRDILPNYTEFLDEFPQFWQKENAELSHKKNAISLLKAILLKHGIIIQL